MDTAIVMGIIANVIAIVALILTFGTLCMFTNLKEDIGKLMAMEQSFKSYIDAFEKYRCEMSREISKMERYQTVQTETNDKQDASIKRFKDILRFLRVFGRTISKETSYRDFRKKLIYCDFIAKANEDDVEKLDL